MGNPVLDWLPALTPRRLRQLWYVPLLALAMGLMMVRLLVMARLLDVPAFGEFSGGILVSGTFCMLGAFGLQSMLQREWPVRIVRHQERRALVLATQGVVVAAVCAGLAVLCAAALPWSGMSASLLVSGVMHGLSQQVFLLSTIDSRSRGDSVGYAAQNLSRAGLALMLSVVAASLTHSPIVILWVDAVATLALAWRFFGRSVAKAFPSLHAVVIIALRGLRRVPWRSALVLMTIGVAGFVQLNLDRWVAADRLGVSGFAQYSFAWVVLSLAQSAQAVINASVYPAVARRFAEHGGRTAFRACFRVSVVLLGLGAVVAMILDPLLQRAVDHWYPQYTDARALIPAFLAIGVLRISDFWSSFLLITGQERQLLLINLSALILALGAWTALELPIATPVDALRSVGWLAALVTATNYVVVVASAWWTQQR
jgi:O-antigen/teichoic acid export membrane protein